jgi:hypothetical protein
MIFCGGANTQRQGGPLTALTALGLGQTILWLRNDAKPCFLILVPSRLVVLAGLFLHRHRADRLLNIGRPGPEPKKGQKGSAKTASSGCPPDNHV